MGAVNLSFVADELSGNDFLSGYGGVFAGTAAGFIFPCEVSGEFLGVGK